jgi:DNA-directed RNA polymerase subunit RPC12/RpoP
MAYIWRSPDQSIGLPTRASEVEMNLHSDLQYGTYRCPVCGHRDAAEIETKSAHHVVDCSYCDTPLEVSPRGRDSVRFSVQVAEAPARG